MISMQMGPIIMGDATVTVPIVLHITDIDMAAGITDTTMYMAVSSVVIEAAAVWTNPI